METTWPDHFAPTVVGKAYGGGRLSSYCMGLEAWRRGLQVTWIRADLRNYIISDGNHEIRFNDSRPQSLTRRADYAKMIDKWETKRRLETKGVPVPKGVLIEDSNISDGTLRQYATQVGYPLVIKPNRGTMGQGVFSNIRTWEELLKVFRHLADRYPESEILMEQHIRGEDYRVMVVGDQAVAAVRRVPANVTGDGNSSVGQLVKRKNSERRSNPFLSKGLIRVDFEVETVLEEQGLALTDVPPLGRVVPLRRVANASAGGDVEDVTDNLPPGIAEAAVRASLALPNIYVAGVDFLYDSEANGDYVVIEMNSRPHIPMNMYPTEGEGRDVPKAMIDYFFPGSRRPAIPGDALLNFDLGPVAAVLRTRRASRVTLPSLPEHHFPVRRSVTFTPSGSSSLSQARAVHVERRAALADISGSLEEGDDDTIVAILGAADETSLDAFIVLLQETLGSHPENARHWDGPLTFGFEVADGLILP